MQVIIYILAFIGTLTTLWWLSEQLWRSFKKAVRQANNENKEF